MSSAVCRLLCVVCLCRLLDVVCCVSSAGHLAAFVCVSLLLYVGDWSLFRVSRYVNQMPNDLILILILLIITVHSGVI